jgi:hypothetical protein
LHEKRTEKLRLLEKGRKWKMRKKIGIFFVVLGFACLHTIPAQGAVVSFNILDNAIMVNESFDVEVFVMEDADAGDLTIFGFDVDPSRELSLMTFDGYMVGPDFEDEGSGSFVAGSNWFNPNAGSNILLATLSFTAGLLAGTDTLNIEGLFDGFDHGLYYEESNKNITGSVDIQIIPLPGAAWLLAFGLLGLLGLRKKFR